MFNRNTARVCATTLTLAAALTLAGCGGAAPSNDTAGKSGAATASAAAADDWKATDACAMIDKAAMGAFIGSAVESADLALIHESDGTTAATSECTYMLAGGGRAQLMLRKSPINDNTADAIALARGGSQQTIDAFGGGKIDDVPGLGKAAFWVGKIDSLNVFIGEDRMAIITLPSNPAAKDQAIAIAKRLGA